MTVVTESGSEVRAHTRTHLCHPYVMIVANTEKGRMSRNESAQVPEDGGHVELVVFERCERAAESAFTLHGHADLCRPTHCACAPCCCVDLLGPVLCGDQSVPQTAHLHQIRGYDVHGATP